MNNINAFYDNIIFDVNGGSKDFLEKTLELAFNQRAILPIGWSHSDEFGMILYSYISEYSKHEINKFPSEMTA